MTDEEARYIFDVGAHTGEDSDFYLRKGFKVVAVEAFPDHVASLRQRFATEIEEGRYFLEPVAIGLKEEEGDFYVHHRNSDWHTAKPQTWRGRFEKITVPFVRFASLLAKYPPPYYVKIDIEGNDGMVIEDLTAEQRPPYLSYELAPGWKDWMVKLRAVGYTRGQIVDQSKHRDLRAPYPSREGSYVDARFTNHNSGLFGLDLPDAWVSFDAVMEAIPKLTWESREWYDVHLC